MPANIYYIFFFSLSLISKLKNKLMKKKKHFFLNYYYYYFLNSWTKQFIGIFLVLLLLMPWRRKWRGKKDEWWSAWPSPKKAIVFARLCHRIWRNCKQMRCDVTVKKKNIFFPKRMGGRLLFTVLTSQPSSPLLSSAINTLCCVFFFSFLNYN